VPDDAKVYLDLAARLALRAAGYVEPNPLVGAVVVKDGRIIGMGHHRTWGGLHAEREALADCRHRGENPRDSTVYVTLEPCAHVGKQPPCTEALIEAGVRRVVAARPDPNPVSSGGSTALRQAGIACEFSDASDRAIRVGDAFVKRISSGLPWVIAKWAQTFDGRLVTRPREPRWISGEVSRRRVHRLRARVDVVMTGIGTVLADDPMLSARGVHIRRVATRCVVDSHLQMPLECALVRGAREIPLLICSTPEPVRQRADRVAALAERGATVLALAVGADGCANLPGILRHLARNGASNVLLECGPRLLNAMFDVDLVDEAVVHIAPPRLGGEQDRIAAAARAAAAVGDSNRFVLCHARPSGVDTELIFVRRP
jgi:diaminohydroxyphosphoribosylaminopyrimidine deaminase/5-amino-6-(5-phosphoribosylamino)uracil reductase